MKKWQIAAVVFVCLLVGFSVGRNKSDEVAIAPPVEQVAPAASEAPAAAPAAAPMAPAAPEPAPSYASAASGPGATYTDPATGMKFVYVKGGCYQMGDTFGDRYSGSSGDSIFN